MAAVPRAWPVGSGGWPGQPPDEAEPADPPERSSEEPEPPPDEYEPL